MPRPSHDAVEGPPSIGPSPHRPAAAFGTPVCRLGLASRGDSDLEPSDCHRAMGRGVNFLNWPGNEDALSRAVAELGRERKGVVVCAQFEARTVTHVSREPRSMLETLKTADIDVLTFDYVEEAGEREQPCGRGGALESCDAGRRDGRIRRLGPAPHRRGLAADVASGGRLDVLIIRHDAAHRGAEREDFPLTNDLGMPVIAYTALGGGRTPLRPTPEDPPGPIVPPAQAWYRRVLASRSVAVASMAPHDRAELEEDPAVLDAGGPSCPEEYARMAEHGRRVRRYAGGFP